MMFSIVLPTYNRANKIVNAIKSVLDQTYHNFELVIIDDGSTDNTKEIVDSFSDDRIFYFKKKNEERNIARNFGINKAKGKYVTFLDSDDELYANHLSQAYSVIVNNNFPKIVHLNFEFKGTNKRSSYITINHIQNVNEELIKENFLHCNSMFIETNIAKRYQFLNSSNAIVGEDYYLWLTLASRYKIQLSTTVTNVINEHKKRSLNNIDVNKLIIGTNEISKKLKKDDVFINFYGWKAKRFFAYSYIFLALQLVIRKKKKDSIKYLLVALKNYFPSIFSKRFLAVVMHLLTSKMT